MSEEYGPVLFEFKHSDETTNWRTINDTVMGGVSNSEFRVEEEGIGVFSGSVSLENNGGFASVCSRP
ncbi:MAG: CIA30 family protein, partial [bacterium]